MRYWILKDTGRVIAVDCPMVPRWTEITKAEFDELVKLREEQRGQQKEFYTVSGGLAFLCDL